MPRDNANARLLKQKLDQEAGVWDAIIIRQKAASDSGADAAAVEAAGEPNTEEKAQLIKLQGEIKDLDARVAETIEFDAMREANAAKREALNRPGPRPGYGTPGTTEIKTAGEAITEAAEFKDWLNRVAPQGQEINAKLKLESPVVKLKDIGLGDLREIGKKDLVMSIPTTAGGGLVRRDYGPWPVDLPLRGLTIRDVVTILQTGSNLIEYVRVNSLTRAAAIVPEATSATDDAALKPKAAMSIEVVQTGVKTIAVIMLATRTILSDAPQLQSMMTQFMQTDIDLELEEEVISGPGGANHFTGLENTQNLTPQAFDTDRLTTARKARTAALIKGRARSTGFLLNPYDWEALDLTKDAENRYYFGGPLSMGTKMLWGLPVIESEVIPQGTFYTGDLKQMVIWDRQDPQVYITDSNRDYFERNIITILYEGRWAFGVLRPPAIVKGDFVQGANS